MSSVDKKTADEVIAGKYPEDKVCCIVEYSNMFDGRKAYKLIYEHQRQFINQIIESICGDHKKIYWSIVEGV